MQTQIRLFTLTCTLLGASALLLAQAPRDEAQKRDSSMMGNMSDMMKDKGMMQEMYRQTAKDTESTRMMCREMMKDDTAMRTMCETMMESEKVRDICHELLRKYDRGEKSR